jgi:hypothetical protein
VLRPHAQEQSPALPACCCPPSHPTPFQACNGSKYQDLVRCTAVANSSECVKAGGCSPLPLAYGADRNSTTVCVSEWLLDLLVTPSGLNTTMQQVSSFSSEIFGECSGARVSLAVLLLLLLLADGSSANV